MAFFGFELDCLIVVRDRSFVVAFQSLNKPSILIRLRIVRIQLDSLIIVSNRTIQVALGPFDIPTIVVSIGIVGIELDCPV